MQSVSLPYLFSAEQKLFKKSAAKCTLSYTKPNQIWPQIVTFPTIPKHTTFTKDA